MSHSSQPKYSPETIALHYGYDPLATGHHAVSVPLVTSTAYAFADSQEAIDIFALRKEGFLYSRLGSPTVDVLEKRLAAYEGGVGAVVTATGQSAHSTLFLTLLRSGDHVVASNSIYGGTFNLLESTLPRFGITTTFVDINNAEEVEAAITDKTKLVFCETLSNPRLTITNIPEVSEIAHRHGLPLVADITLTEGISHAISEGADVLTSALTKIVCGNGTTLGGAIIDSGRYDWGGGRFPELSEPCPTYNNISFTETFGPQALITALRAIGLRDLGTGLSPLNAYEMIKGLETLDLRAHAISDRTRELAEWLESNPKVAWVRYPTLPSHDQSDLCRTLLGGFGGGILTFAPKGGYHAARKVTESTRLFTLVANLGDSKSLITHPAGTTHSQMTEEELRQAGISDDLIRLSIGLESIEDLKADLQYALDQSCSDK